MLWYGGNISEAVQQSKQKNAVFVVFIEGDNDASKRMLDVIEHDSVSTKLSNQEKFLAIKLKSASTEYTHFARIYQFVPEPCIFFIGRSGVPLDIVCDGVDVTKLSERVDRILNMHETSLAGVQPSTSGINLRTATEQLIRAESHEPKASTSHERRHTSDTTSSESTVTSKEETKPSERNIIAYDVICDGDVCVKVPNKDGKSGNQPLEPDATTQTKMSAEEKLAKAKELIEAKRREKELKAKEEEKAKEVERRTTGQGVAELKRWQKEQEMKQLQEDQMKEKKETEAARQRVLAQIAQDRVERKARMAQVEQTAPAQPQTAPVPAMTAPAGNTARLQLKLPNGSTHSATFEADSTLAELRLYIRDNVQVSGNVSLWMAFPRRELTQDRDAETLLQLGLVPSAALLVLAVGGGGTISGPASVAPVFSRIYAVVMALVSSMILEPAQSVYRWISERLLGATAPRRTLGGAQPAPPATRNDTSMGGRVGGRPPADPLGGDGPRIRRIRDLGQDDDRNTYNGNSTQQL